MKTELPRFREPDATTYDHTPAHQIAEAYAAKWLPVVERKLRDVLAHELRPGALFLRPLEYVLSGGKRFRPLLTLAACELVGADPNLALEAGCAIEYLHASSLLIDDLPCMDGATERRGRLPLYRVFGEADTILVSLVLINHAHEILARVGPAESATRERFHRRVCQLIGSGGMIGGQQMDLWIAQGGVIPSSGDQQTEQWLKKTSALITAALAAGAHVGNARDEQIERLEVFGRALGEAYQMADDAQDFVGEQTRGGERSAYLKKARLHLQGAIDVLEHSFAGSFALSTMVALAQFSISSMLGSDL